MVDISYFAIANPTNETRNSLKIKNARFEVIHLDGLIVSIELDRAVLRNCFVYYAWYYIKLEPKSQ